jgi:predicted MPP superfamily phosphohydrolase
MPRLRFGRREPDAAGLRRRAAAPAGSNGRFSRRDLLHALAAVGVGTAAGAGAHGFWYERHHLEITRTTAPLSGLPDALAGLRIGFLTDLHRSDSVPHDLIARAVAAVMAERPDLIVLGGDYVTDRDRRYVGPVAEALAPLAAPHGVFAILGNHDDDRDVPAALEERRIEVLADARTRLTVRGESLDLIGIRYWTRRMGDIARALRGAAPASILLAHTPARLIEAAALGVPLMLSGHTHGGQVVLPGLGAVAARNFPVVAGLGQRDNTTAFVSRGVGTVYLPIRIDCPPEVAILTLSGTNP